MIKRNLLKIGLILTLSFTLLTGCRNKDNTTAKVDTSTTIEESTSERESESATEEETTTEVETTTEIETEKVAEIEVTQPVTEAPKPAVTEAPKPAKTQPATEAPKPQPVKEAPKSVIKAPAEKETIVLPDGSVMDKDVFDAHSDDQKEIMMHSRDDYNWAVKKVAEWKKINPDPAYLIGMFGCYAQSNWYYDDAGIGGKWKHAISYYGSGVCEDIEICFRTFCDVAGIPCEQVIDWSMEHTWDKVIIDGVQYEVDMVSTISVPKPGQFESLVKSFNTRYYGNDEFKPNRLYALSTYGY